MKFTLESSSNVNLVRAYSASGIRIGELELHSSCLVTAEEVIGDWEPQRLSELSVGHLERIYALRPEVVLVGTGMSQQFAPYAIRASFAEHGIGIESMDLGAACRTFNILVQEDRRVVAALFLR